MDKDGRFMCSLTSFISIFPMNSRYYRICLFSVICNIHFKQGKCICKLIHLLFFNHSPPAMWIY